MVVVSSRSASNWKKCARRQVGLAASSSITSTLLSRPSAMAISSFCFMPPERRLKAAEDTLHLQAEAGGNVVHLPRIDAPQTEAANSTSWPTGFPAAANCRTSRCLPDGGAVFTRAAPVDGDRAGMELFTRQAADQGGLSGAIGPIRAMRSPSAMSRSMPSGRGAA